MASDPKIKDEIIPVVEVKHNLVIECRINIPFYNEQPKIYKYAGENEKLFREADKRLEQYKKEIVRSVRQIIRNELSFIEFADGESCSQKTKISFKVL